MPRSRLRPLRAAAALLGAIALATLYHAAPAVAAVPGPTMWWS
jgi:hypothetical protein